MAKKIEREKKSNIKNVIIAIVVVLLISFASIFGREIGEFLGDYFGKKHSQINNNETQNKKIDFKTITSTDNFNSIDANALVILIQDNCIPCDNQMAIIKEVANENQLNIYTLDMNTETFEILKPIIEILDLNDEIVGSPTTLIYKGGKIATSFLGEKSKKELETILIEENIINK